MGVVGGCGQGVTVGVHWIEGGTVISAGASVRRRMQTVGASMESKVGSCWDKGQGYRRTRYVDWRGPSPMLQAFEGS